jgi:signal transduction histidine kinase
VTQPGEPNTPQDLPSWGHRPWERAWRGRRPWGGPPGSPWGGGGPWPSGSRPWRGHGRRLFLRLAAIFGAISLLLAGWVAAIAFLLTRLFRGGRPTGLLVWLIACLLVFLLPALVVAATSNAFRRIALPLANLMAAADAVARGDLTARVPVFGLGGLARLADAFNHMVAELQRADLYRRNLTADVAHELRTPLHVIQGNLEGILDGVYEPNEENITATLGETRLLARLVDDLRTLSLAEAGQLPLQREQIDAGELLADVTTSFSGQAEAAGIRLEASTTGDNGDLTLWGDPERLDQVLSNLLANALRHTPAGGAITIEAKPLPQASEARPWPASDGQPASIARPPQTGAGQPPAGAGQPPNGRGVRIVVSDTGEGIAAADLPFIFDRFWRGDPSRSHAQGAGSGLGLAIARQLVQAHGGRIRVESQPGQGTRFTIDLPA